MFLVSKLQATITNRKIAIDIEYESNTAFTVGEFVQVLGHSSPRMYRTDGFGIVMDG